MMLGQVFSGIYEKSATAIVSLAEGVVSAIGVMTFFGISSTGIKMDMFLLPSIFTEGYFAAMLAPYIVRLVPNSFWRYAIPGYAFVIGVISLVKIVLT